MLATGCGLWAEPAVPDAEQARLDRTLTLSLSGARTGSFDGRVPMNVVARKAGGANPAFSLASVIVERPLDVPTGTVLPEVSIGGRYTGDGTYEVPVGSGDTPPAGTPRPAVTGVGSSVALTFFGTGTGQLPVRYGFTAQPCTVRLDRDATEGSLSCPALAASDGSTIAVEMTWKP